MNIKHFVKNNKIKLGIGLLFLFIIIFFISSKKTKSPEFSIATKKDITQKVSVTGQVFPLKNIDLQFQIQGKVEKVNIDAGEKVKRGDNLIKLNDDELSLDVSLKKAAKDIAQANLTKVLKGASKEEIQTYESAVKKAEAEKHNYQIALENEKINLENVKKVAGQNIESNYEDALNVLSSAQTKIFNAYSLVSRIQRDYFISNTQDGIIIKNNVDRIKDFLDQTDLSFNTAQETQKGSDIDNAVSQTREALESVSVSLNIIREIAEGATYRNSISSADKTLIDNQKAYINTALTDVVNSQQNISSAKITNVSNIDSAQKTLDSTQESFNVAIAGLEYAQSQLNQIKASPQQYDVDLYQAKLDQAEISLIKSKKELSKTILNSPCDGTISDNYTEEGEIVKTSDVVVSMVCENSFQIEVEVPESDIGKINLGNKVEISLDAFLGKTFSGKVIKIYPTENIIQGVVYYKVKVVFDNFDQSIKSGMTTNLEIITQEKDNVLAIPQRLITKQNQEKTVKVLVGDKIKKGVITTGISNEEGWIEVLSGLKEGDKIIK